MKKIIVFCLLVLLISGCSKKIETNGKVTDASSKYLDKGYSINIMRSSESFEDAENYGKGYVKMTFNVITDYYSTNEYSENADYNIKKKVISNVRVISGPKMGMADELYADFTIYNNGTLLTGTNNKFETTYSIPHTSGVTSSVAVVVNKIALYDSSKYTSTPSLSQLYSDLGIDRASVSLKLGFRVELITNDNKTFYKDYEITIPPESYDITSSEFHLDYTINDVSKMEPFLEK